MAAAEIALGIWLLSGWSARIARVVAIFAFTMFAIIAGWLAWMGVSNCGCFENAVHVPPFVMAILDATFALGFAFSQPKSKPDDWSATDFVGPIVIGLVFTSVMVGVAVMQFGSVAAAIARMRGEALVLELSTIDFGRGVRGENRELTVTLQNLTDRPVRIIGGNANCTCTALEDLPTVVPPHGQITLTVGMHFIGATAGRQWHEITYTTDDPATPKLRLLAVVDLELPRTVLGE